MKRSIVIKFKNGTEKELPISKASQIDVKKEMIHLDKRADGTWLLVWTKSLIDEFKDVDRFEIRRED
jgi:hypothetical protein